MCNRGVKVIYGKLNRSGTNLLNKCLVMVIPVDKRNGEMAHDCSFGISNITKILNIQKR
jgi:hypothetical protein